MPSRARRTRRIVSSVRTKSSARSEAARCQLLIDTGRVFSSGLERDAALQRLTELSVVAFADGCAVRLLDPADGPGRLRVFTHSLPELSPLLAFAHGQRRTADLPPLLTDVLAGRPLLFPSLSDEQLLRTGTSPELREAFSAAGVRTAMMVPLTHGDRVLGTLSFFSARRGRRYSAADLAVAEELGRRAAQVTVLTQLQEEAVRSSQGRRDLLAFVTHDLATPLFAIDANANGLRALAPAGPEGDRARRSAEDVLLAAEAMRKLARDLQELGRLETRRLPLQLAEHAPAALVEAAFVACGAHAEAAGVTLKDGLTPGAPPVRCDAARFGVVLAHLLSTALRHSPRGATVEVSGGPDGDAFRLSLTDAGPPIAREEPARLVERYWRRNPRSTDGGGLGMYLARAVVEAHGGRLWVDPERTTGATLHLTLPRQ